MTELSNPITITLDKERHPRLTLRGMIEFEKLTGKSLVGGFKADELPLADVSAFMWACLIHEDKELTYDAFLDMVDISNMPLVIETIGKCINQSLPKETDEEKKLPLAG